VHSAKADVPAATTNTIATMLKTLVQWLSSH